MAKMKPRSSSDSRAWENQGRAMAVGAVTVEVERCGLAEAVAAADGLMGTCVPSGRWPRCADFHRRPHRRAFHRGFLEHLLRAVGQGQLADLRRAIQRLVAQADHRAGEFSEFCTCRL